MSLNIAYRSSLDALLSGMGAQTAAIATAIKDVQSGPGGHNEDLNNPHQTGTEELGLENVPNWPAATKAQAIAGEHPNSFISPKLLDDYMDTNVYSPLALLFEEATNRLT